MTAHAPAHPRRSYHGAGLVVASLELIGLASKRISPWPASFDLRHAANLDSGMPSTGHPTAEPVAEVTRSRIHYEPSPLTNKPAAHLARVTFFLPRFHHPTTLENAWRDPGSAGVPSRLRHGIRSTNRATAQWRRARLRESAMTLLSSHRKRPPKVRQRVSGVSSTHFVQGVHAPRHDRNVHYRECNK